MGRSYGISFRECGYKRNFMIGIGMIYSPQNIIDKEAGFRFWPVFEDDTCCIW